MGSPELPTIKQILTAGLLELRGDGQQDRRVQSPNSKAPTRTRVGPSGNGLRDRFLCSFHTSLLADRVREHEGGYESSGLEDNVSDGGDLDAEAAKLKRDRPKKKPRTEAPAGPSAPSTGHAPETVFTAPAPRAAAPAHPVHQVATPVSVVKQSTLSQLSTPVQFQARPMAVASPQVSLPHVSPMQMPSYAGTPQHFTPMPSASGSAPPSFSISESPLESGKKGSKSKAPKEKKPAAPKKPRKVQTVPRDAAGWPILPYKVGSHFTIHNLGTIVTDREAFHTERYVYPVGYRISR